MRRPGHGVDSPASFGLGASVCLAVALGLTSARAAEPVPRALGESRVRDALREHLSPDALERLLARDEVAASIAELVAGWDGVGDEVTVRVGDGRLFIEVVLRERRCGLRIDPGPEAPKQEPVCEERVVAGGARVLDLDPRLWEPAELTSKRPPKAPRPKPASRPSPPAPDARPTGTWGEAAVAPPTVLRRESMAQSPYDSAFVTESRLEHERLKTRLTRPGWHDPLLPRTGLAPALEAGDALAPQTWAESPALDGATAALAAPFGAGRMRTDLPVPTLSGGQGAGAPMPRLTEDCEVQWRMGERAELAPELACYRSYAWNKRLDGDALYQALEKLTMVFDIPLARWIMAQIVEDAKTHRAHELVWAFVWLEWVSQSPDDAGRVREALARLSPEERRTLRRKLARFWVKPELADKRPLLTRIFERHLTELYPEARDFDGLPRRAFVTDTWLWANNWLATLDSRPEDAIKRAYLRLPDAERRVIDAFVREPALARRWARAPGIIALL